MFVIGQIGVIRGWFTFFPAIIVSRGLPLYVNFRKLEIPHGIGVSPKDFKWIGGELRDRGGKPTKFIYY